MLLKTKPKFIRDVSIVADEFKGAKTVEDIAKAFEIPKGNLIFIAYKRGPQFYYKNYSLPKKSGGTRTISAPYGGLRIIQKKLSLILHELDIKPSCSHAFHRKRSILTNASPHMKSRFVFNADLKDFFETIHFGRVSGVFAAVFNFPPQVANLLAQLTCFNGILPQGSPSSPAISNLVAYNLDKELLRIAKRYKVTYSRYADDITFSSRFNYFPPGIGYFAEPNIHRGPAFAGQALTSAVNSAGFEINPEKTRLQTRSFSQVVTGLKVNEFPNVERKRIKKIRKMIYLIRKFGMDNGSKAWLGKSDAELLFRQKLYGELAFVGQIRGLQDAIFRSLCADIATVTTKHPKWVKAASEEFKVQDIFLSHASEDKDAIARPIFDACEKAGLSVFYDDKNITWGDSIVEKINKGLGEAKIFLPIITPIFLEKKWPKAELNTAFSRFMNKKNRILPIVHDVSVEENFPLLGDILYKKWNGNAEEVAAALKIQLSNI